MHISSPQQVIEVFHLLFLQHLGKAVDRNLYVLKGGCNLRFFMKSIRYSEDIDFDVKTTAPATLQKNVNKVLDSTALQKTLQTRDISIAHYSFLKQTQTTQRWKIMLQLREEALMLPTKIEFSRRDTLDEFAFNPIDSELLAEHFLFPISLNHYTVTSAIIQKIKALAYRSAVQCRDVFDLYFLFQKGESVQPLSGISAIDLQRAEANSQLLSYKEYKSQVVAFLVPEYQKEYESSDTWEDMKQKMCQLLSELVP